MALVLFQNTFLTDAEPYLSGEADWVAATTAQKEGALRAASDYLNDRSWLGQAKSSSQVMSWPRTSFDYFDTSLGLVVTVADSVVPERLKRAVAILALHLLKYPEAGSYDRSFDSISVGPISLSNSDPQSDPGRIPSIPGKVELLVQPLTRNNFLGSPLSWWRAN